MGLGLVAFLRRRRPAAEPAAADPAEELRRKLAESRVLADEPDPAEEREVTVDAAEPGPGGLEERRRQVHEQARAAVEQMKEGA